MPADAEPADVVGVQSRSRPIDRWNEPRRGQISESPLSGQLESKHFLRTDDVVARVDGTQGYVVEGFTLYAVVERDDGKREELDQFDPRARAIQRTPAEG
ncbi:MAG: hypothetical protein GEU90_02540 [Gemmatimonas sp.]|nr:hypothetical protein [Gemmatimonas sp.]